MEYTTTVVAGPRGGAIVPVPFDPDEVWGRKPVHHVAGTVDGTRVRGAVESVDGGSGLVLGPACRRDCGVDPGDVVAVDLHPVVELLKAGRKERPE